MKKLISLALLVASFGLLQVSAQQVPISTEAKQAALEALPSEDASLQEVAAKIQALVKANPQFALEIIFAAFDKFPTLSTDAKSSLLTSARMGISESGVTALDKTIALTNLKTASSEATNLFQVLPNNRVQLSVERSTSTFSPPPTKKNITSSNPN